MIGLGIDTGGTYTDGVLYDFDKKQVIETNKRLTTPGDLSRGINALMDALSADLLKQVKLVSLSTTLATNACVEGRGGRIGLILMGYDENLVGRLAEEYGLINAGSIHVIPGAHTQWGEIKEMPAEEKLRAVCDEIAGSVDAIGIVEYWGVRNPEFEQWAKERARAWTGLPVTTAHELTFELNSMRRAATTLLNARLIPLIDELMTAVKTAMIERFIDAPLMIVKSDGSLMTEEYAREYPVETLLSGPASSATGAMRLSGAQDMVMLDIGGTTTDMAIVRGGRTQISETGVDVGEWRTGTHAIAIRTVGLGGDSAITLNKQQRLTLGPNRAVPLCSLATEYPQVKATLGDMLDQRRAATYSRGVFFVKQRDPGPRAELSEEEMKILDALHNGPLTIEQLSAAIGSRPYFLRTQMLESLGLVIRSMLTPTDLMHIRGDYDAFDAEASSIGLSLLAWQMDWPKSRVVDKVLDIASERVYRLVAEFLLERMARKRINEPESMHMGYRQDSDELDIRFDCRFPIVGIGAPARAMLNEAATRLHTELILPADFAVANAIGAITGSVIVEETVLVQPIYDTLGIKGYSAYSSEGFFSAEDQAEVCDWAKMEARRIAETKADAMGATGVSIEVEDTERSADSMQGSLLLELRYTARAVGGATALM